MTLGQWLGQWAGKWLGGGGESDPNAMVGSATVTISASAFIGGTHNASGSANLSISASGDLRDVADETVTAGGGGGGSSKKRQPSFHAGADDRIILLVIRHFLERIA